MGKIKYDLKDSKKIIGPLYPRLLDKQGREIDGFHREEADSEWPTTQLEHIDTDVKYWIARITANTHRRRVEPDERKKEVIELAKALRAEGHEGSLIKIIAELTTFSIQHIGNLLKDHPEFKERPGAGGPSGVKLGLTSTQKSKRKPRKKTTDKEKLENLYKKVETSAFTGKISTSNLKLKAEELGLNVESYEIELNKLKACLRDSVGRRYEDVKYRLNQAYESSIVMKQNLTRQIKAEKERVKKANEELRKDPELRKEVAEEIKTEQTSKKKRDSTRSYFEPKKRSFDVWNIAAIDLEKPFGDPEYPGAIPGDIVANVLMWFLPEGGKVIDPMAGGGVTEDVCRFLDPIYDALLYDNFSLSDYKYRGSIDFNDILTGKLPEEANGADLIFADPPYGPQKDYGTNPERIFLLLEGLAKASKDTLKDHGLVSVLMQNYYLEDECVGEFVPLIRKTAEIFEMIGFKQIFEVTVPLYGKVARSKEHMTHIDRRLMVFRKEVS